MYRSEVEWPSAPEQFQEEEIQRECRRVIAITSPCVIKNVKRQYSFQSLIRITAWIRRFINNCHHKNGRKCGNLSHEEINEAETSLIWSLQNQAFREDSMSGLRGLQLIRDG